MTMKSAYLTLIESIEFDMNGDSFTGRGGHGGLISHETMKLCGEGRFFISQYENRPTSASLIIERMKRKESQK